MRYFVTVGGRTLEVAVDGDRVTVDGDRVTVDGTAVSVDLASAGALRHVIADGVALPLVATPGDARGTWVVDVHGHHLEVEVVDERTRAIRAMTGADRSARSAVVRAPMPGLIVRVEVAEGDLVAHGQGVVIMEAMKMENELNADGGGIVWRIHAQPGTAVEKGTVLVEFQAP
jgi:pyruvate carboxylase subunit B